MKLRAVVRVPATNISMTELLNRRGQIKAGIQNDIAS